MRFADLTPGETYHRPTSTPGQIVGIIDTTMMWTQAVNPRSDKLTVPLRPAHDNRYTVTNDTWTGALAVVGAPDAVRDALDLPDLIDALTLGTLTEATEWVRHEVRSDHIGVTLLNPASLDMTTAEWHDSETARVRAEQEAKSAREQRREHNLRALADAAAVTDRAGLSDIYTPALLESSASLVDPLMQITLSQYRALLAYLAEHQNRAT